MKEQIIGAFIAALILFTGSVLTLFNQDPTLTFAQISQAGWVSIIGGSMVAFLKDYQAITTRKLIGKVTGGDS